MINVMQRDDPRGRRGFSLIEVMAAVLLTSIVISVAVAFQINLGAATTAARERLRTQRQAVALLDRIARDLAGTYFIAPVQNAPIGLNPWIFLTARHFTDEGNSDAIKFVTRNYQSQDIDGHHSDLAVVAYYLNPAEDGAGYQLMRWRRPHMPQVYDATFPTLDNPDADIIGENLASFELSLIDRNGSEFSDWDSQRHRGRESIPVGVTIEIAMLDPEQLLAGANRDDFDRRSNIADDFSADGEDAGRSDTFSKTVILPLAPLDWTFLESEARKAGAATTDPLDQDESGDAESTDEDEDDDGFFENDDDNFNGNDNNNDNTEGGISNDTGNMDDVFDDEFDSFNFKPELNRALACRTSRGPAKNRWITA